MHRMEFCNWVNLILMIDLMLRLIIFLYVLCFFLFLLNLYNID
jgi:hypothetical protein